MKQNSLEKLVCLAENLVIWWPKAACRPEHAWAGYRAHSYWDLSVFLALSILTLWLYSMFGFSLGTMLAALASLGAAGFQQFRRILRGAGKTQREEVIESQLQMLLARLDSDQTSILEIRQHALQPITILSPPSRSFLYVGATAAAFGAYIASPTQQSLTLFAYSYSMMGLGLALSSLTNWHEAKVVHLQRLKSFLMHAE